MNEIIRNAGITYVFTFVILGIATIGAVFYMLGYEDGGMTIAYGGISTCYAWNNLRCYPLCMHG